MGLPGYGWHSKAYAIQKAIGRLLGVSDQANFPVVGSKLVNSQGKRGYTPPLEESRVEAL